MFLTNQNAEIVACILLALKWYLYAHVRQLTVSLKCALPNRWFTINMSFIQFHRKLMQMTNVGPNPPAVLSLSDGGHVENLGILPLLKLRLKKIIAVDGGRTLSDLDYGRELLLALDLARKKLGCSFLGMDGRDIAEDIRDKFVERSPGSQPSSYR